MVEDISRVAEVLRLNQIHLVGHSIAGDEMTRFALTYPDKVRRIVYLEAAYDRVKAQALESHFPKIPPSPSATQEAGSPQEVRALIARTEILMPEAEIRATRVFGPDGQYLRPVTPDPVLHSVATMVEHPDYAAIRAPIMAIYAVYTAPVQLVPKYATADRSTRGVIDQIFGMWQPFAKEQRDFLRNSAPKADVVEIPGASHYVFLSHRERVATEVKTFLSAP
jgi:non-heme chloroperoxidase